MIITDLLRRKLICTGDLYVLSIFIYNYIGSQCRFFEVTAYAEKDKTIYEYSGAGYKTVIVDADNAFHKGDIVTATLRMGNIKIAGEDAKLGA